MWVSKDLWGLTIAMPHLQDPALSRCLCPSPPSPLLCSSRLHHLGGLHGSVCFWYCLWNCFWWFMKILHTNSSMITLFYHHECFYWPLMKKGCLLPLCMFYSWVIFNLDWLIFQGRGIKIGRGRGNLIQTKLTLPPGASMVPLLEQLVVPGHSVSFVFFIYNWT